MTGTSQNSQSEQDQKPDLRGRSELIRENAELRKRIDDMAWHNARLLDRDPETLKEAWIQARGKAEANKAGHTLIYLRETLFRSILADTYSAVSLFAVAGLCHLAGFGWFATGFFMTGALAFIVSRAFRKNKVVCQGTAEARKYLDKLDGGGENDV